MNETTITVIGNVVDEPQRRKTEAGVSVVNFRVASTARRFDRQDGQWVDGDSLYLKVTCWRQLADNVSRSVVKGDPIVVTGRLYTRTYEIEGQRRSSYEMEALALGLDLTRGVAQFSRTRTAPPTYEVNGEAGGTADSGGSAESGGGRGTGPAGPAATAAEAGTLDALTGPDLAELEEGSELVDA